MSGRITCSWCGELIPPKAPRMRLFESESIRVSGKWLAHFHPECGDMLLDHCEERLGQSPPLLENATWWRKNDFG